MTITGTNLSSATAVDFGSNAGTIVSDSATQIVVKDPAGTAGTVDVTVTTAGGASATSSADQFTYAAAPAVTSSVSPSAGPLAGGTTVTIIGTNLAGATAVDFGSEGRDDRQRFGDPNRGDRSGGHGGDGGRDRDDGGRHVGDFVRR